MDPIDWLLDSDPAIRWQVMRDLTDASAADVAAERALVATTGWGAQLLALATPPNASEVPWGESGNAEWLSLLRFDLLKALGVDPEAEAVKSVVGHVRDNITWHWWDNRPFFHGEVEPCINGRVLAISAYFGQDWGDLLDKLLGEQMADRGWNCEQEHGSVRGSFHSSINVLEGLFEVERAGCGSPAVSGVRKRGEEYLLERHLMKRLSTGKVPNEHFLLFKFPMGYRYDVLRGLDHLRAAGLPTEPRMAEGLALVTSKRTDDRRWSLDDVDLGDLGFGFGEEVGQPSRWITLHALRVLRHFGA
ncbi:MAG: hypothetical protein ABI744_06450 [Chloroflexota bacterium]